jgi:MFS family permease
MVFVNYKNNPPRRTAVIWMAILIVGIIIIFLPTIIGLDGFAGGYAISTGGLFIGIFGLVGMIIYLRLASKLDRITREENVLAHWIYAPDEWKQYTEREHREDAAAKRSLFILVAVISVIVGIIFYAIVQDNPLLIAMIILGIIIIVGLAAYFSTLASYLNNKNHLGETYIALDGVYLNRQTHIWNGLGTKLEEIIYDDDKGINPQIIVTYSAPGTYNNNSYTVRIPVPPGQEKAAQVIVKRIAETNR